jgi:hypothetical protein
MAHRVAVEPDVVVGVPFFNTAVPLPDQTHFIGFAHLANPVGAVPADVDDVPGFVIELFFRN